MPAPSTLRFRCPFCRTVLTVPIQLAGTAGPCPKCEESIRAPQIPTLQPTTPYPPPQSPTGGHYHTAAASSNPQGSPVSNPIIPKSSEPTKAIQPREIKKHSFPDVTQPSPASFKPDRTGNQNLEPKVEHQRRFSYRAIIRALLPLAFVGATGILIIGVRRILLTQGRDSTPPVEVKVTDAADASNQDSGAENTDADPTSNPNVASNRALAAEAMLVLEKFLKAQTLEERMPLMETTETMEALADTMLAKPFPEYRNIIIDKQKSFQMENVTDYFFGLEFINEDGSPDPYIMAVRNRGGSSPKVLADPILDLLGGRLKEYAEKPHEIGHSFYTLVSALPNCTDPRIPNREKKITLKLLPHAGSNRTINAYASKVSEIGEMLKLGNYDLVYGKPEPCVVLIGWNTVEREDAPYLEVLDIKTISWNP